MRPPTAAALAPFTPDVAAVNDLRRGLYPNPVPATDAAAAMLGDAGLWAPPSAAAAARDPGAVGRWVRRLAATLLGLAAAPELRAVAPAAAAAAPAAELLLPLALANAARSDPAGLAGRRAALSAAVAIHLLPPTLSALAASARPASSATTPAPAAVRILLAVLDHLRSVRADAILARGPPRHPDAPGEGEGDADLAIDASAGDWATVFWLDLPYLRVAAAALGAGCPTTALLYAELEAEARGGVPLLGGGGCGGGRSGSGSGGLLPSSAAASQPADASPARPRRLGADLGTVLLAAHRASPDPDGVYFAAAAAGGADANLALFQLAGDWAAVAAVTDAAAVGSARGGDGGLGGPALAARAAGLPAALAHMGCRAAVAAVSSSVAGHGGGALADARAEAAWRMGQWRGVGGVGTAAGASPAASPASASSSFHASVCACLTALEDGDLEGAGSTLATARARGGGPGRLGARRGRAPGGGPGRGWRAARRPPRGDRRHDRRPGSRPPPDAGQPGRRPGPGGRRGRPGRPDVVDGAVDGRAGSRRGGLGRREASALGPSPRDGAAYEAAEPLLALRRAVSRALGAPAAESRALTAAARAAPGAAPGAGRPGRPRRHSVADRGRHGGGGGRGPAGLAGPRHRADCALAGGGGQAPVGAGPGRRGRPRAARPAG